VLNIERFVLKAECFKKSEHFYIITSDMKGMTSSPKIVYEWKDIIQADILNMTVFKASWEVIK
jgi:hypothetical protein